MKTYLLKLQSTVKHGVGTSDVEVINFIYSALLEEFESNYYNQIDINQVGEDLNEFVEVKGKKVWINIRYPVHEDFNSKSSLEKNSIRLDLIHTAMLRLAKEDKRTDIAKLEAIRKKIIAEKFSFDIIYKTWPNKKGNNLTGKVIIRPEKDRFDFYVEIEGNNKQLCKMLIYSGQPTDYYINALFNSGKWKNLNEFIITGKSKEVEIHVMVDDCKVNYVNVSGYNGKAPFFEMMKAGKTKEDKDNDYKDWVHSLPPGMAAIITHEPN